MFLLAKRHHRRLSTHCQGELKPLMKSNLKKKGILLCNLYRASKTHHYQRGGLGTLLRKATPHVSCHPRAEFHNQEIPLVFEQANLQIFQLEERKLVFQVNNCLAEARYEVYGHHGSKI